MKSDRTQYRTFKDTPVEIEKTPMQELGDALYREGVKHPDDRSQAELAATATKRNRAGWEPSWPDERLHLPKAIIPTDAKQRKAIPAATGFVDYFPLAIMAVAALSKAGNDQHNPGKPLHWDRAKSGDEADALMRHLIERGTFDTDGIRHSAKVAWRAMALLQKELEQS